MRFPGIAAIVAALALSVGACATEPGPAASTSSSATSTTISTVTAPTSSTSEPPVPRSDPPGGTAELLAQLTINDNPSTGIPYDRDAWPHWDDIDGDGCDARQQTLIAQSTTPAQVDPFGCVVVAGDWFSIYDGVGTDQPGELDVDHVVALENAHNSGGWRWDVAQRRLFANDLGHLIAVSASSNRSKGSSGPNEWRPPRIEAWCELATRWATTKVKWSLTATTVERDALGQMLDTCTTTPAGAPTVIPPSTSPTSAAPAADGFYANCAEARAAGVTPLLRGQSGYSERMDGDNDGIACE